ncbi:MAG: transposase [Candidatus Limnocylindria bacterium]
MAGALEPVPPPLTDLIEPEWLAEVPAELASLLALLPRADLYLQDEVQFALHPTLTRVWCRRGRHGQRLVEAPGANRKLYGFGLVDWRDGWFDGRLAPGRTADAFCAQVRAAVARSQARGRVAIVVADNAGTHTAAGSKLVRTLVAELADRLRLVYTPAYDPDANRIEWLWRMSRRAVTHNHRHPDLAALAAAALAHFRHLAAHPEAVLAHIGSPGCLLEVTHEPLPLAA